MLATMFTMPYQGDEILIRLFDDHGLVAVVNSTRVKKFLKSALNAVSLKNGATEPALKKLVPPNTYLVVVPSGCSTKSIAKIVAIHCSAQNGAVPAVNSRRSVVKVGKRTVRHAHNRK